MMTVRIMDQQKNVKEIKGVTRIFTIQVEGVPAFLYYETVNDQDGYGTRVPFSKIKSWDARATVKGGNIQL